MIAQANSITIPLKDESVQCVVTSPPYWGLRSYKGVEPTIWGGLAGCSHEWGHSQSLSLGRNDQDRDTRHTDGRNPDTQGLVGCPKQKGTSGQFCRLCNAWRGCLGLEPTPELFVEHLVGVFREIKRVLRKDGVVFLNLGDSYFGSSQTGGTKSKEGSAKRKGRMFKRSAGVPRAAACDTSGKAPGDSRGHDCLCGNLCDVCREVYRRRSHNDGLLVAMLTASLSASILEYRASESDHLPNLDAAILVSRNSAATPGQAPVVGHADEPLRASLVSMLGGSSPQLLDACLRRASHGECLLCGHSLGACVHESVHTSDDSLVQPLHSPGSASRVAQQVPRNRYRDKACEYCARILSSEPPNIQPQCTTEKQSGQVLKPKDLCGIPWRVALALQADGWWLRSDIIWHKPNPMPESVTDRPTRSHEYVFLLTKSARYAYDADAVSEPLATDPKSWGRHGNKDPGLQAINSRAMFGPGRNGRDGTDWGNGKSRNRRTVWTIPTRGYSGAHFATFPPALVTPCILAGTSARGACPVCGAGWRRVVEKIATGQTQKMADGWATHEGGHGSFHRDGREQGEGGKPVMRSQTTGWRPTCDHDAEPVPAIVLDPFAGSGTVGAVCRELGRRFIGLDLSGQYLRELALPRAEKKNTQAALLELPLFAERWSDGV